MTVAARIAECPSMAAFYRACPMGDTGRWLSESPPIWRRCACGYPLRWDWTACSGPRHPVVDARPRLYASRTGGRQNLDAMAQAGIRLLATPQQLDRYAEPMPPWAFGLDNGAFGEGGFNPAEFRRALGMIGCMADWIVLPDVVCGGLASLRLSLDWRAEVLAVGPPALLPVQDGMTPDDVRPHVGRRVGIFVGGSTDWKETTMGMWGALAREVGAWLHVGRVNTQRRMALAVAAGADSVDGTSPTRFSCRAAPLADSARQGPLFGGAA